MKLLSFLFLLILAGCNKPEPTPIIHGCMDKTSLDYEPAATVDNGLCRYGGTVAIYQSAQGNRLDTIQLWLDTANGTKYHLYDASSADIFPQTSYGCADYRRRILFLPLGMWSFIIKKHFSNGQVSILTKPKTVLVYKNYCDTLNIH
jgi:hypothetical protein